MWGRESVRKRGQTAVLGLVLLIGIVSIVGVVIFLSAGGVVEDTEQQVEQAQIEQSFVELGRSISTATADSDGMRAGEFDAGDTGAIAKTNAGWINISSGDEELLNETVGAVEYEGDDGAIVAYQSGGVWSEQGNETRMLSAPNIEYDADDHTLWFPISTVEGERSLNSGDISIEHKNAESYEDVAHVEDQTVTITIQSEYYRGWETYFEQQADGSAVQSVNHSTRTVVVELGIEEFDGDFGQGARIGGGGVTIECTNQNIVDGPILIEDEQWDDSKECLEDEDEAETTSGSLTPIDDVVESAVAEGIEDLDAGDPDVEAYDSTERELDGGKTYVHEGDFTPEPTGGTQEADLADGEITILVDGDLVIDDTDFIVKNYDSDESLHIYTTGNLTIDNQELATDEFDFDDPAGKHLQIYGTSEMLVGIEGGSAAFEGALYAPREAGVLDDETPNAAHPGNDNDCEMEDGTYADACIGGGGGEPRVGGSIVSGPLLIDANKGNIALRYDESLATVEPEMRLGDSLLPPDITFLNVAVHELDIENTNQ